LTVIQLCLTNEVLNEFFFLGENNILAVRTTLESLSEEVVGESVDSEATSLPSPHA